MYEPQELKDLMKEKQEKVGYFEETLKEEYKVKRLKRLAKFTPVTHAVIETLQLWGIPFTLCEIIHGENQKHRVTTDIYIPYANIVIRQVDERDEVERSKQQCFYVFMKQNFYPFFIRRRERKNSVIKKLMNVLQQANEKPARGFKRVKMVDKTMPTPEPQAPKKKVKKAKGKFKKRVNNK